MRPLVHRNCSASRNAIGRPISLTTLSHYLLILREAGLVRSERRGIEVLNSLPRAEIDKRFPGLTKAIARAHEIQLAEREGTQDQSWKTRTTDRVQVVIAQLPLAGKTVAIKYRPSL